jgi:Effector Associated Constant Component 1
MNAPLAVEVAAPGADNEELDELTAQLREELLGLDVDDVVRAPGGPAPDGTRALDVAAIGALVVLATQSADLVTSVLGTIHAWLSRRSEPGCSVRVTIGERTIELTSASTDQQERLVAEFIRATQAETRGP